MNIVETLKRY